MGKDKDSDQSRGHAKDGQQSISLTLMKLSFGSTSELGGIVL